MCSRLACVAFGCAFCGTAIEFGCDHGVRISPVGGPLFCHVRDESGADAMRVTFYFEEKINVIDNSN